MLWLAHGRLRGLALPESSSESGDEPGAAGPLVPGGPGGRLSVTKTLVDDPATGTPSEVAPSDVGDVVKEPGFFTSGALPRNADAMGAEGPEVNAPYFASAPKGGTTVSSAAKATRAAEAAARAARAAEAAAMMSAAVAPVVRRESPAGAAAATESESGGATDVIAGSKETPVTTDVPNPVVGRLLTPQQREQRRARQTTREAQGPYPS